MRAGLLVLVIALSGCGTGTSGDPPVAGPLSVEEALTLDSDQVVTVDGYVLAREDGTVLLCAGLSGSSPPQCGRPALAVRDLDVASLAGAEHESGLTWARASLRGRVRDAVLTVVPAGGAGT